MLGTYKTTSPAKYRIDISAVLERVLSARFASTVIQNDKARPEDRDTRITSIPIYVPLLQLLTMILGFIALYFRRQSDPRFLIFTVLFVVLGLTVLALQLKWSIKRHKHGRI